MNAIADGEVKTVATLMAFKKFVDVNSPERSSYITEWTPLTLSYENLQITHLLIQAGVGLSGDFGDVHPFFQRIQWAHQEEFKNVIAMLLMLLACGMEPDNQSISALRKGKNGAWEDIS